MNPENYPTCKTSNGEYQFFSDGRRGVFEMRVVFEQVGDDTYNLAFGVWDPVSGSINDSEVLRNGDMDKILATVGFAVIEFLRMREKALIIATGRVLPGANPTRNRKYRMSIGKHLDWLARDYHILGFLADRGDDQEIIGQWPHGWSGTWKVFNRETNFDAFLLRKK
ncbi:MAG: hypothetical protein J7619_31010 [Dyadobacter sp.]|uniref:DUF6934 family protein n=1 Tax=Dyadobacter sp. TaxID=1914288 RepID=UPI001B2DEE3F|nr:hypothetical protein [Dyadobacter sp.]MBO9617157.1 hypothetical protein [Dyadobacter sp.]